MPASPARAAGQSADLSHTLKAGFPVFGLDNPVRETVLTIPQNGVYMQSWKFDEHIGTQNDVPGHFRSGGRLLPQITPSELVLRAAVIDISSRVSTNPDTQVTVADVQQYEAAYGQIPTGAVVFMYSGLGEPPAARPDRLPGGTRTASSTSRTGRPPRSNGC